MVLKAGLILSYFSLRNFPTLELGPGDEPLRQHVLAMIGGGL